MIVSSARRLIAACALPATAVAVLLAPSAASATVKEQCSGANIAGNGSTLQKLAQLETWDSAPTAPHGFNKSANPTACNGSQKSKGVPTVNYTGTGSGPGMESWGLNGNKATANFKAENAFVGTDQPPSKKDSEEIEESGALKTLLTIPVLQAAVTVPVNLPANCVATSTAAPGRLVLNNKTLEFIFRGKIKKWSEITEGGDELKTAPNATEACVPTTSITRVVRLEGSGTTATFDKYLFLIFKKPVDAGKTWEQLGEELENTKWPEEATVIRGKGNGGVASEIVAHPGSIGYVNLADARNNTHFTPGPGKGGPGTATFWTEIQRNGSATKSPKYSDPSTNLDAEARANANCEKEVYTNGKVKFPPASTEEAWNEVTTKASEPKYTICGFTYDLSFSAFSDYPGTSEAEATTAHDYFTFMLSTGAEGGQTLIAGATDYLALPTTKEAAKNVQKIAQKGAEKITF